MIPPGTLRGRALFVAVVLGALVAGGSCAAKKRREAALRSLSAEATYARAIDALAKRNLQQAREEIERMQYATEDRSEIEPLARLALADATFYQDTDLDLIDARSLYLDFVALYGHHRLAPYAQLQAGMCSLEQVRHPSRDQTQTYQAIEDLRVVEQRYPGGSWARAARDLANTARANLAEHEFGVGRFYLDRKAYEAAAARLRHLLERFPEYPEKEKVLFHLGESLRHLGKDAEGLVYLEQLVEDFPDSEFAEQARKVLDSGAAPKAPPAEKDEETPPRSSNGQATRSAPR